MPDRVSPSAVASELSPRTVVAAHLGIALAGCLGLGLTSSWVGHLLGGLMVGSSCLALAELLPEAAHQRLTRRPWLNEVLGRALAWPMLLPLSAYRIFEADHQRATNTPDDPQALLNRPLNWIMGFPVYVLSCNRFALRTFDGRERTAYFFETVALLLVVGAVGGVVGSLLGWWLVGLWALVGLAHNVGRVAMHLNRPAGRFADTWQVALPKGLSRWFFHADHHLERHLRPDVAWFHLPLIRAELDRGGFIPPEQRLTLKGVMRLAGANWRGAGASSVVVADDLPPQAERADAPRWAGRAAIRARRRQPNHPSRESVGPREWD